MCHAPVLKLWAPVVGFKHFTRGEALSSEIPPECGSPEAGFMARLYPSLSYSVDVFVVIFFFFAQFVVYAQLAFTCFFCLFVFCFLFYVFALFFCLFLFFSAVSYIAVDSACLWKR